jgi:parallel beta-helix repeat protein
MKSPNKNSIKSASSFLFLISGMAVSFPSIAANYYVATWGNDGTQGTFSAPFKTIARAQNSMKPGDMVYVRGGIYAQTVSWSKSGTATAPLQIRAYPGEVPVIDGQKKLASNWGTMVNLAGNYVHMDGFEVKNGLGQGVVLTGHHNKLSNSNIHDHAERGVLAAGDYSVVEYNRVWGNAWYNCRLSSCPTTRYPTGGWGTGLSAARDKVNGITENAILRGNTVFNNWGEGLSSFEADGTILEGNTVYDNWALNVYVSESTNTLVTANLIYVTPNNAVQKNMMNIGLCDETTVRASANVSIVNNLIMGGSAHMSWWADKRNPGAKMSNVVIANNTFVQATLASSTSNAITFRNAAHENVQFLNNIVKQNGTGNPIAVGTGQFMFSSNLWSEKPVTKAAAYDDVIADPQLSQTGPTLAGQLKGEYFNLKTTSPAIGKASVISNILDDFFGDARDSTPDIGGDEL